jgi:hypothetical protein
MVFGQFRQAGDTLAKGPLNCGALVKCVLAISPVDLVNKLATCAIKVNSAY